MQPTPELRQALIRAAIALWGQPTKKGKLEWRFGRLQSKSIDLEKLVWRDHEADEGAGVLELCKRAGIDPPPAEASPEIAYPYHDAGGKLLKEVVRRPGHKFVQRRPNHNGGWIWDTKGVEDTPYRLPELLAAHSDEEVFLVEGEKDVDNVRRLGLVASCNAGGAGKWSAALNKWFTDRDVVILPDNDEPGRKHATAVAEQLTPIARSVRIVALPDLPDKGDVSDWIGQGGTREQLLELLGTAGTTYRTASPEAPVPKPISLAELQGMVFTQPAAVVPGLFVEGLTLLAGKPKAGKSFLVLHAAIATGAAGETLGVRIPEPGDVLYCALEDTLGRLQRRVTKLNTGWPARCQVLTQLPRLSAGGMGTIRAWCDSVKRPRLIIIDTLALIRDPAKANENGYAADYVALLELRKLAQDRHLAVVVVHHLRKAEADDPFDTVSGTLGLTGAPDAILVLVKNGDAYTLHGKGRELEEFERPIRFDRATCLWTPIDVPLQKRDPWLKAKNLTLLHRAFQLCVDTHGKTMRPFADGPAVRAVPYDTVQLEFWRSYPSDSPNAADKNRNRRQAFDRAIKSALEKELLVSREIDGISYLWSPH